MSNDDFFHDLPDNPDDDEQSEEMDFEWEDDTGEGTGGEERTGITGELNWQGEDGPEGDERTGLTGMLSWQDEDEDAEEIAEEGGYGFAWQRGQEFEELLDAVEAASYTSEDDSGDFEWASGDDEDFSPSPDEPETDSWFAAPTSSSHDEQAKADTSQLYSDEALDDLFSEAESESTQDPLGGLFDSQGDSDDEEPSYTDDDIFGDDQFEEPYADEDIFQEDDDKDGGTLLFPPGSRETEAEADDDNLAWLGSLDADEQQAASAEREDDAAWLSDTFDQFDNDEDDFSSAEDDVAYEEDPYAPDWLQDSSPYAEDYDDKGEGDEADDSLAALFSEDEAEETPIEEPTADDFADFDDFDEFDGDSANTNDLDELLAEMAPDPELEEEINAILSGDLDQEPPQTGSLEALLGELGDEEESYELTIDASTADLHALLDDMDDDAIDIDAALASINMGDGDDEDSYDDTFDDQYEGMEGIVSQDDTYDEWFQETSDEPDWLTVLDDAELDEDDDALFAELDAFGEDADGPTEPQRPTGMTDELLRELSELDSSDVEAEVYDTTTEEPLAELDELLSSFDVEEEADDGSELAPLDLNAVFGEQETIDDQEGVPTARAEDFDLEEANVPDWLLEAAASRTVAASMVGEKTDRPVDELDNRLQNLHETGIELGDTEDSTTQSDLLPAGALAPVAAAAAESRLTAATDAVHLTPEQERGAAMLRELTGAGAAAGESRRQGRARRRREGRKRPFPLERILIAILLIGAILIPFLNLIDIEVGETPPATFEAESELLAFARLNQIDEGELVLFAAEYGPTGAAELDPLAQNMLAHIITRGGRPVIVGTNAIGLIRAEAFSAQLIAEQSGGEEGRNEAFYPVRYLPGGSIGLRDLSANTAALFSTDTRGDATNLDIPDLDTFSLIVIVAESSETVRAWMEQVRPETNAQFVIATSFAASPISQPYLRDQSQVVGYLVGYEDAVTYNQMLVANDDLPQDLLPTVAVPATRTPTFTPTATYTATPTATSTPTATATPEVIDCTITNRTADRVNLRSGPGTEFDIVGGIDPNENVSILGTNDAGDWYQLDLELDDDTEAWVFSSVVTTTGNDCALLPVIGAEPQPTATRTNTPRPSNTPAPTATDEPTEVPSETPLPTETQPEPEPTRTVLLRPTFAPTATATSSATIEVAIVIADVNINVRNAPDGAIISVLRPGAEVPVIGYNDDESWTQVRLGDGREGWVASFLLEVEERLESEFESDTQATEEAEESDEAAEPRSVAKGAQQQAAFKQVSFPSQVDDDDEDATEVATDDADPTDVADEDATETATDEEDDETATPRPTRTPRATATPRGTVEATPDEDATDEPDDEVVAVDMDDQGRLQLVDMSDANKRLESTTIGLMAIIGLILLGNLFYIIRHLLRRGRA